MNKKYILYIECFQLSFFQLILTVDSINKTDVTYQNKSSIRDTTKINLVYKMSSGNHEGKYYDNLI